MKGRVLVVDDDVALAEMLGIVLRGEGYDPVHCGDGEGALAVFREVRPDLVLLDVMLPDANGFDILQRMKQVPALKTTPVIMTTAEATRASVMRGLVGGADGYLTKPFKTDILLKGVRTVLGIG